MYDLFWFLRSKRCAVCASVYAPIELTIRYSGRKITHKWFCSFRHLDEWREKVSEGKMERTKVIVVKK